MSQNLKIKDKSEDSANGFMNFVEMLVQILEFSIFPP